MAAKKRGTKRATAPKSAGPLPRPEQALGAPEPGDESSPPDEEVSESGRGPRELPVAGLVASAGGLDAFKKFLAAMPADSGIAFVLIPHLDPTHESLMVELLARQTAMPVVEAAEGTAVEADHVYIIPPNKNMTISGGVLRLTGPVDRSNWRTSIDLFLRSLADDQQERAIAIILSGTGSHGAVGLTAVKAAGGMAMVQDPRTTDYPRMPESAIATGLADYVLPAEQMPEALIKYVRRGHANRGRVVAAVDEAPNYLSELLALLRARTKLDFRGYRKKMLARRLERRIGLSHFDSIAEYLDHLRDHPEEVKQLARDLLISVTRFFRDPDAFEALEKEAIAPLVRAKNADASLRVWVPGCATGEEAYSLAMLLLESQASATNHCRLQIFATDVDKEALAFARRGIYPEGISADVAPERLVRFFTRVDDSGWQLGKPVRETVTFAAQNLIANAPFSKMDLISCRNILIYLEPEMQQQIITLLHFALNQGGYLFLGPSETIGRQTDLFEPVSKQWRIYRRIGPDRAHNLQFAMIQPETGHAAAQPASRPPPPPRLAELMQNALLSRLGMACVVINHKYEILHFAGPTEDYLAHPSGPPTLHLLSMARKGLESKLRLVIHRAIREKAPRSINGVIMRRGGEVRRVDIEAEPLNPSRPADDLLLISFREPPNPPAEAPAEAGARAEVVEPDMLRQLEQELETTRNDLQGTIEELESANEELKASNEEVMSMNEELQSTNEELETSKEELQSLNEELSTVNNQLQDKVVAVEAASNDMANLLNATHMATLFLDARLRIKLFTPTATRMFNLIAMDVGRSIGDIVRKFADDDLLRDSEEILGDLAPREKEVRADDGRWYVRRIMPYRTLDNRIDGVVINFVDITERKQAADAIVRRLAAVVESSADAIFNKDLDGTIRTWNRGAEELYGYRSDEVLGRSVKMFVPEDRLDEWTRVMAMLARGEHVEQFETERLRKDGRRVAVSLTISPVRDNDGKILGASVIGRDITQRLAAEEALRQSERFARSALDGLSAQIAIVGEDGTILTVNRAWRAFAAANGPISGNVKVGANYFRVCEAIVGRFSDEGPVVARGIRSVLSGELPEFAQEYACHGPSEEYWFVLRVTPFPGDGPRRVVIAHENITRRKELEHEVVEIASLEQRRIGQDLHDTVSQELTALDMLAGNLAEALRSDPSNAPQLTERLILGLKRSQQELRAVIHGLLPVAVDAEGLMAALSDLANRTDQEGKVTCVFECPRPVLVEDNVIATQLYLIAQEAVHNAIKHARCRNIRISVESDQRLVLKVQDDGIGIPDRPAGNHEGLGLHIMQNRAAIIRATLTIEPAKPAGTVLTCALARKNDEAR
ncbi:MAG: chemotaxis protein CheB [Isosphaeraceae bacterium]